MTDDGWTHEVTPAVCGPEFLGDPAAALVREREPCPDCDATAHRAHVFAHASIAPKAHVESRGKPAGGERWFVRSCSRLELFRKSGRMHVFSRHLDRRGNRYVEHVADQLTGEVIRPVDEPLTGH